MSSKSVNSTLIERVHRRQYTWFLKATCLPCGLTKERERETIVHWDDHQSWGLLRGNGNLRAKNFRYSLDYSRLGINTLLILSNFCASTLKIGKEEGFISVTQNVTFLIVYLSIGFTEFFCPPSLICCQRCDDREWYKSKRNRENR